MAGFDASECVAVDQSSAKYGGVEKTPLAISAVLGLGIDSTRFQTFTGCTTRTCDQLASHSNSKDKCRGLAPTTGLPDSQGSVVSWLTMT